MTYGSTSAEPDSSSASPSSSSPLSSDSSPSSSSSSSSEASVSDASSSGETSKKRSLVVRFPAYFLPSSISERRASWRGPVTGAGASSISGAASQTEASASSPTLISRCSGSKSASVSVHEMSAARTLRRGIEEFGELLRERLGAGLGACRRWALCLCGLGPRRHGRPPSVLWRATEQLAQRASGKPTVGRALVIQHGRRARTRGTCLPNSPFHRRVVLALWYGI